MSSKLCLLFALVASVSAGSCPAKIQCSQGTTPGLYVEGRNYVAHFWNAERGQHEWGLVENNDNSDLCVIGFTPDCDVQMFGSLKDSFPGRDSGTCQYNPDDQAVYCICRDSHFCNMAPDHYAPYAQAAFLAAGLEIRHNCPASFNPPPPYIPPTAC